jgi:hypothetical protein
MTVLMVRYTVGEDRVVEVERGIEKMFTAIDREHPDGVRFALVKLPDGVTFVGVLELEDGAHNPLLGIPAAREYQQNLANWVVGQPPVPGRVEVVGSYGLFEETHRPTTV